MIYVRKIILVVFVFLACWGVLAPTAPQAATIDAVITVDNIFNFFLGDSTGSNLRYIGQGDNWYNPLSLTEIACQPGDFIYVAGWDDSGTQMFLAQFSLPGGTLLTNTPIGTVTRAVTPTLARLSAHLSDSRRHRRCHLDHTSRLGPNDSSSPIWPPSGGIDASARHIWHPGGDLTDPNYVLFRSKDPVCPPIQKPLALTFLPLLLLN